MLYNTFFNILIHKNDEIGVLSLVHATL